MLQIAHGAALCWQRQEGPANQAVSLCLEPVNTAAAGSPAAVGALALSLADQGGAAAILQLELQAELGSHSRRLQVQALISSLLEAGSALARFDHAS